MSSYSEYKDSKDSIGRCLYELSEIGVPLTVVDSLKFGDGIIHYGKNIFGFYKFQPNGRPLFNFCGYGKETYQYLYVEFLSNKILEIESNVT